MQHQAQPDRIPLEPGFGWAEKYLGGNKEAEERLLGQFARDIGLLQEAMAARGDGLIRRGFHAKGIASIPKASFRVSETLPKGLWAGPLHPGVCFPVVVRFSNAADSVQPDTDLQGRGIAFRLLCGEGPHDFLLSNSPTSHARDGKQFMALAAALTSKSKLVILLRLIGRVGPFEAVRMLWQLKSSSSRKVDSLATETYWSRTPYAFGQRAVRFVLKPQAAPPPQPRSGPDYLREELIERLRGNVVCFELAAQLYLDDACTPLEDGSVEWKETDSPPIAFGTLTLPLQDLTSATTASASVEIERMAFSPWNVLGNVRPLGSLNRARRVVYQASATNRRGQTNR